MPIFSIHISTTSSCFRYFGGFRSEPTPFKYQLSVHTFVPLSQRCLADHLPDGVPVMITLPCLKVVPWLRNDTSVGTSNTRSDVCVSCLSSPFTDVFSLRFPGSVISYGSNIRFGEFYEYIRPLMIQDKGPREQICRIPLKTSERQTLVAICELIHRHLTCMLQRMTGHLPCQRSCSLSQLLQPIHPHSLPDRSALSWESAQGLQNLICMCLA